MQKREQRVGNEQALGAEASRFRAIGRALDGGGVEGVVREALGTDSRHALVD